MPTYHGGIVSSDYWEYQPGERVMTIDGFPGVVELVEDGPIGGAENYVIKLDNGMGGGNYSASMLAKMPTSRAAAGVHLAVEDYPELGGILDERPDPGKMTFAAALSAERQEADAEDHDESGGNDTPSSCSYCGSTDFQDLTDNGRVRQATCATCGGTMSAHEGAQWTPELIGDPSNHPSPAVDPRSGASVGTGAPGQAGINDFVDFDSRVSTTAAYEAGPCPTCRGKGSVSWTDQDPDWDGDPDENPGKVHTAPCDDCDGKGHVPAVSDDEIAHLKQQAEENHARSTAQHVQEKHPVGEVVTYGDVKGCGPRCPVAAEWDRRGKRPFYHQGAVDGPDWCTWRRTARCTFPGDITTDGHVLGIPQDRGPCPWETRWQQQVCPISEPGPGAGMERKGSVNLTLLKIAEVPTLPDRVGSSVTTAALEAKMGKQYDGPHQLTLRMAQDQTRNEYPELTRKVSPGEASEQLRHVLRAGGHPDAEDSYVLQHRDPDARKSQTAFGGWGEPVVALHPERMDLGTVAHEAAHHLHIHHGGVSTRGSQPDEVKHGPDFVEHYRTALNAAVPGTGDALHTKYHEMLPKKLELASGPIGKALYREDFSRPREAMNRLATQLREKLGSGSANKPAQHVAITRQAGHLDLYHRTTPEAAQEIYHDKAMRSKENTGETYWSTHRNGEATGYGSGLVHIRVPEHLAEIEDEFPDGEEHYRVHPGHLQPHHFVED